MLHLLFSYKVLLSALFSYLLVLLSFIFSLKNLVTTRSRAQAIKTPIQTMPMRLK